jgi:DNA-binding response OmpR family regulator
MNETDMLAAQHTRLSSTILLVEDEDGLRSSIAKCLSGEGYQVLQAGDGKKAVAALRASLPDLIITDLIMPDQDGLELLSYIRKRSLSIPVIAMSGGGRLGPSDYLRVAQLMGAVRTLEKPFDADELLAVVQGVLS